ncbi:MAG: ABC transporter permease subunit [Ilumatobacteraceae bacterium]
MGTQFEEAARDLGATRLQALRLVLLPQLGPAIFASLMVTFATSVDDFVVSSFLSTGAGTETVPIKIYWARAPARRRRFNALATVMLLVTLLAVSAAALVMRRLRRNSADAGGVASISV